MASITGSATGGNWSATTAWVGGVVPVQTDDVLLTSASGNITIDGTSGSPSQCRSIDCTTYTGTLTHATAKQLNVGDPAGSGVGVFKLVASMAYVPVAGSVIKFVSTTGVNNITWGGKNSPSLTFDGVGGSWQYQDAPGVLSTATLTLTNGALDINSKNTSIIFSSNNSNIRSLTMGTATWTAGSGASPLPWDIGTSTNMTLSAGSATIVLPTTSGTATFNGGGLTYGAVTSTAITTGFLTITGANTFSSLMTSPGASNVASYQFGANQTVTGTFTFNSNSITNRAYLLSTVKGTARTITAAAISSNGADLQDIVGAGAATWNLSSSTFGGGNCGGNSGITFNTPKNCFMKTAVSVNWSAANWFTTSGGSTGITPAYPLPQDTAVFDANSVTTTGKTITVDAPCVRLPGMNWTGVLNSPSFTPSGVTPYSVFGSVTFDSGGMTIGNAGTNCIFEGRGAQTIKMAGLSYGVASFFTVNCAGGSYTQQDAFSAPNSSVNTFVVTSGAWSTGANNFTLTGASSKMNVSGGTFTSAATVSLTGAISSNITVSSGTLDASAGVISMTGAGSTMTLSGGTLKAGTLTRTGFALAITGTAVVIGTGGATFSSLTAPTGASNISSPSGTAMTITATAITVASSGGGGGQSSYAFCG